MVNKLIFRMTSHCRQRYHERVKGLHWNGFSKFERELWKTFNDSIELLGWQNDTYMVEYYRKKYGTTKVKIHYNGDIVFISMRDNNISNLYSITTCFIPNVGNFIREKIPTKSKNLFYD